MTDADRLVTGAKREADDAEQSLRPQYLREFIGQEQARSNLKVFIEAAKARGDALDHVLFAGPPGPRQDHAGPDHGARAGRGLPLHLRARHRQGRRPRRAAHQPGGPRRPLHRRDPPPQPGGRGDPLSGHGGLPARPHHRRRAGGALGQDRPRQVHADRRHHAHRPAHHAAARPLRHSRAPQFLHPRRARPRSSRAAPAC